MAARTVWAEFLRRRFCLPARRGEGGGGGQRGFQGLVHVDGAAIAGRLWRRGVERGRDAGLLPGCRDIAGLRKPGALAHGRAPVSRSGGLLGGAGSGCRLAARRTAEALRWAVLRGGTACARAAPLISLLAPDSPYPSAACVFFGSLASTSSYDFFRNFLISQAGSADRKS